MGLSPTVSEINFSHPRAERFPSELVKPNDLKKLEWWGYKAQEIYDDINIRLDTMLERERRTDRQTPADS